MYNAVDLFCGAGGFSEGLIQAGFHIIYSSDFNPDVEKTYVNRHKQLGLIQGYNTYFERIDIRELKGEKIKEAVNSLTYFKENKLPTKIDAVFGGPPCQGFSKAGRRNPNDPRNMLFKEYIRVINEIKPNYVVMENVTGFLDMKFYNFTSNDGEIYPENTLAPEILKKEFNKIGYNTLGPQVLNAAWYGVPQQRNRIILIAYKNGCVAPKFPKPKYNENNYLTITDAIGDLNGDNQLSAYQKESKHGRTPSLITDNPIEENTPKNNEMPTHNSLIAERFSLYLDGESTPSLRKRIKIEGIDISLKPALIEYCSSNLNLSKDEIINRFKNADVTDDMINVLLTKKNIRKRLARNHSASTVLTIADDYISPYENRTFSVRELARFQSFDDSFEFLGKRTTGGSRRKFEIPQYSQVGNAVPPLLSKNIAQEIIKALNRNE